ncbi:MAG TPA: hypothetical protein VGC42_23820 [Kofleriaceae bacterium]
MGRTALYRDPAPLRSPRVGVQLDRDELLLRGPDGRLHRHLLDGYAASVHDGVQVVRFDLRPERRFVRMLVLERERERLVIITPPEHGAVAPNVVRLPEAPGDAVIVDAPVWDAVADWLMGGGRLAGCSIAELARLAELATPPFAALIGEVAAQRAAELAAMARGPRAAFDAEAALRPLRLKLARLAGAR